MDLLGLIHPDANPNGTAEHNLKDLVYENMTKDQIDMFEMATGVVLGVAMSFVPGGAGAVLSFMDNMTNVSLLFDFQTQMQNVNREANDIRNVKIVVPSSDVTRMSESVMQGLRGREKIENIQKMLQETYGADYKLGFNEIFPLTPLISEMTLVSGDEDGKGMFFFADSMDAFSGTLLLRKFFKQVKNLDLSNDEELQRLTAAWSSIRQVAEEVASREQFGFLSKFTSAESLLDIKPGSQAMALLCCVGTCLLIICGCAACCMACLCSGGGGDDDDDDDDD